jgi:outer membrane protein OmpA-like peptidoglycan-associated protein
MKIKNLFSCITALAIVAACSFTITSTVSAQTDNLVPNGGFEDTNIKNIKSHGQMEEFCEDWFAGSSVPVDIYGDGAKGDKVAVPSNKFGTENAADGLCYAGFRAYSKDPKLSRSYLEVQLPQMLDRDVMYCVSFDISLADASRYAVNEIGVVISDRKIDQPNDGDMVRPYDVTQKTNKVFQLTEGWEKFCGTFVGTGQEEFLLIGCFGGRNDLEIEKIKRPQGLQGPQFNHAYYYIDNVSVIAIEAKSQCKCSKAEVRNMDFVYVSSSSQLDDKSDSEKIKSSVIYYAFLKSKPTGVGKNVARNIVAILKANPGMNINIIGHSDSDEFNEGRINARFAKIGQSRADKIKTILLEAGISSSRITISDSLSEDPANTRDSEISRAQNRRVTFELN